MSTSPRTRATQLGAVGFAAVALACAALAAVLVSRLVSARGYTGDRVRPVVVARRALPAARPLVPEDVDVVSWPEKHVPEGVIGDPAQLFAGGKPVIPSTAILEGEPIVPARLANPQRGTALAALVRDGRRAIAVKVDDTVGRAGLVYPGALVDVVGTFRNQDHVAVATVAVSGVRVLAVEDETDVATRRPRSAAEPGDLSRNSFYGTVVTLEVAPEEAEIVSLIAREGKVDLALRNGADDKPVALKELVPLPSATPDDPESPDVRPQAGILPASVHATPNGRPAGARTKARIELRAVDSGRERQGNPDKPEIETYHAR
jgi:pilus assembly protein CpaB